MSNSALRIFLLGCGGHGRVVLDALLRSGITQISIIDPLLTVNEKIFGVTVVPESHLLKSDSSFIGHLINGLGGGDSVNERNNLFAEYESLGFQFTGVIHPFTALGYEVTIDKTAQVMAGVVVQNRVSIGQNCVINTGATIDHDCYVGNGSVIGPGATLCGGVEIKGNNFIGSGAVILPYVKVGLGARVGAGAVVLDDVAPETTVVGNPARAVGSQT